MRVWDQWEESSKRQVFDSWKTCTRAVSVSSVEPWEACHCLIFKRDTETENHQSVEKQVLQVCSQCVFESEASVVVWEAVWNVFFLIVGWQVWLHCFVFSWGVQYERQESLQGSHYSSLTWTAQMNRPAGQCFFQSDICVWMQSAS